MKTNRLAAALRLAACALLLAFAAQPAAAQNTDTYFYTPNGGGVNGAVGMCLNAQNKAVPCSASGVAPSPVTVLPPSYTPSAPSGSLTLTAGGTPQNLFAANEVVHGCTIQNPPNATEPISVNFFTTAANAASGGTTSVSVAAGTTIPCSAGITTAVSWVAATTGHAINAWKY